MFLHHPSDRGLTAPPFKNSLHALSRAGLVRENSLDGKATLFDSNLRRHHHFVCDHCGVVEDIGWFDAPKSPVLRRDAAKIREFEVVVREPAKDVAKIEGEGDFTCPLKL